MTPVEIEIKLKSQDYIEPEMIVATFDFWFADNGHIRSPFPLYIRDELRGIAIDKFLSWSTQISDKAKKDINDEILAEKFEEILFEAAESMVLTEDEKLTIKYPFMIRIGDVIKDNTKPDENSESNVIDRWILRKGDEVFMKVKCKNGVSGEEWETEFSLPE